MGLIVNPYYRGPGGGGGGDPDWSSVALLCNCDGTNGQTTFADLSSNALTIINSGGCSVDTSNFVFGTGSASCPGAGDTLSLAVGSGGPLDFTGGADFTWEFWFDQGSGNLRSTLATCFDSGSSSNSIQILISGSGQHIVTSSGINFVNFAGGSIPNDSFHHWAIGRASGNWDAWLDGVSSGSAHAEGTTLSSYDTFYLKGGNSLTVNDVWLDEIRITNGVCRYTPGTSFTPPSAPFPIG